MACAADILALWILLTEEEKKEILERAVNKTKDESFQRPEPSAVLDVAIQHALQMQYIISEKLKGVFTYEHYRNSKIVGKAHRGGKTTNT